MTDSMTALNDLLDAYGKARSHDDISPGLRMCRQSLAAAAVEAILAAQGAVEGLRDDVDNLRLAKAALSAVMQAAENFAWAYDVEEAVYFVDAVQVQSQEACLLLRGGSG